MFFNTLMSSSSVAALIRVQGELKRVSPTKFRENLRDEWRIFKVGSTILGKTDPPNILVFKKLRQLCIKLKIPVQ